MSVIFVVGPNCTLAESLAAPMVSHGEYADGTDRRTDGRQTVTLRFPLDSANVRSRLCDGFGVNLGFWMNEWRKEENTRSLVLQHEMSGKSCNSSIHGDEGGSRGACSLSLSYTHVYAVQLQYNTIFIEFLGRRCAKRPEAPKKVVNKHAQKVHS